MNNLARVKQYPELDLEVVKYDRKVFYKNLWDDELVEYRGLVREISTGKIVSYPFTKVFNIGENGTSVDPELEIVAPRKVNGFMASVTWYKGKRLTSTTGTLDSDFVRLANEKLDETNVDELLELVGENYTLIFEIVHEDDPHIVEEEPGVYLIGAREKYLGSNLVTELALDDLAEKYELRRPMVWRGKFKDLPMDVTHEGWMIRDANTGKTLAKYKSKHYLIKKFLMRSKKAYHSKQVEEEYFNLINVIRANFSEEEWIALGEQERGHFVEGYFSARN